MGSSLVLRGDSQFLWARACCRTSDIQGYDGWFERLEDFVVRQMRTVFPHARSLSASEFGDGRVDRTRRVPFPDETRALPDKEVIKFRSNSKDPRCLSCGQRIDSGRQKHRMTGCPVRFHPSYVAFFFAREGVDPDTIRTRRLREVHAAQDQERFEGYRREAETLARRHGEEIAPTVPRDAPPAAVRLR